MQKRARQAKRVVTGAADRQGGEDEGNGDGNGNGEGVMSGGWKAGWASSMLARPLWCVLARHLRARNLRTIAP